MSKVKHIARKRMLVAAASGAIASLTVWSGAGGGSSAGAATLTWTAAANDGGIFGTAGNWNPSAVPAATDDIVFAAPATTAPNLTATLGGAHTIQSLTFNAGLAGPVTINTTTANRLTINGRTGDDIVVNGGSHVIAETDLPAESPKIGIVQGANFSHHIAAGATLEISARINTVTNAATCAKNGPGTLIISASNGGASGWNMSGAGNPGFALNAGTLVFRHNMATGNSANRFTVSGGAVMELQSNYQSSNAALTLNDGGILRSSIGDHSVTAGSGTILLNGSAVVDVVDSTLTFSQDLSGPGSFTKTGTGTLSIASDNSYTGNTIIAAGILNVGGGTGISTSRVINVQANASLNATTTNLSLTSGQLLGGGGAVSGHVTTNANTTLSPGMAQAAATLTLNHDLTFNGGTLQVDLANTTTVGGGVNDLLAVTGALNANASTRLSINQLSGALAAGTYTLATFAGTFGGNVANLTLPTARQSLTLVDPNTNPGKLDLVVGAGSSASVVWAGDGSANVWKTNDSVNNFLIGASPDKFFDLDSVTFNDAGSNSPNVNIQGLVQPNTVTVNNANKNYTFGGAGTMVGVNSVIKSGTGTLTIANADGNAITQVDVNAGTLVINNANNIATLNANSGGKAILANASGSAGNISTANVNSGGNMVFGNGGTAHSLTALNVNSGGTLTFANTVANTIGTLSILPGATVNIGDGVTPGLGNPGAAISNNQGTVVYNRPDDWTSTTVIGGSGTVQKLGTGVVTVTASNTYTGPTVITAGVIKANNNAALGPLPGGSVTITDGGSFDVGGFTVQDTANFGQKQFFISGNGIPALGIGALTNTNTAQRQLNAFQKVTLTADATVSGPGRVEVRAPSGSPAGTAVLDLAGFTLTKIGTATFGIARADATPGNIHVTAGTLNIEGSTNITGAGTMTFDTGSTGQFNGLTGTVSRNIVLNGGTITDTSTSATTTVPSSISLATTSNINVNSPGGLTLTGVTSGAAGAGFNKTGTGSLTIAGSNTYSGVTSINNGTLLVASSSNLGNASPTNNLAFGGAAGGTLRTTAAVASPGRSIALNAAGTIDTNGFDSSFGLVDGTGSFTKTGAGKLTVGGHVISGNLTVNTGSLAMTPDSGATGVSHVALLSVSGKLDLGQNKLITTSAVGTWDGVAYTDTTLLIATGRGPAGGSIWDGPSGIITSQSNATTGNYHSIGIATAAQAKGIASSDTGVWAGQTVSGTDSLVMYTYGGDANLDGKLNIDDYGRIDFNVPLGTSGWYNGDFNYDGKINIDDYGVIDFNVGIQSGVFFTAGGTGGGRGGAEGALGVTAVPEPAALSSIAFAAGLLLRRRRGSAKRIIDAN